MNEKKKSYRIASGRIVSSFAINQKEFAALDFMRDFQPGFSKSPGVSASSLLSTHCPINEEKFIMKRIAPKMLIKDLSDEQFRTMVILIREPALAAPLASSDASILSISEKAIFLRARKAEVEKRLHLSAPPHYKTESESKVECKVAALRVYLGVPEEACQLCVKLETANRLKGIEEPPRDPGLFAFNQSYMRNLRDGKLL